ncbi:unnamed protein product, partial [Polarella glacialis]
MCEDVERHIARVKAAKPKPRLYIPYTVYIFDVETKKPVCVNMNTAGGEPVAMEHAVRLARLWRDDIADGPRCAITKALATATRLVHPEHPCAAIYTMHWDVLASSKFTQSSLALVEMAAHLREVYGIGVVFLTMRDVIDKSTINDDGDLCFGGRCISTIYPPSMTTSDDLNGHPTGRFVSNEEMFGSFRAQVDDEWAALDKIEASTAVMAHCWLGGKVRPLWHHLLSQKGALNMFVDENDAKKLRGVMPEQFPLSAKLFPAEAEIAMAQLKASDAEKIVAVNVLRPRLTTTVNGRIAPTIINDIGGLQGLVPEKAFTDNRDWYAITRRIPQPNH